MRAALLNETITFYQPQASQSASGYKDKDLVKIQSIKAYRKKLTYLTGTGINASEEFIASTLIFQVRYYPFITDDMQVEYQNKRYKILLLDLQRDHTYVITLSKLNE